MIYHRVEPRSAVWYMLRLGKPTSSEFHKIVTPTGKLSSQSALYAHTILAEMMLGRPLNDDIQTEYMVRGQELEAAAIDAYEFQTGLITDLGGIVINETNTMACSPDRLVGEDGVLEIKCPAANTHVGYLLSRDIGDEKKPQVQGQLYITERSWVDLMSYHPELPPLIVRVKRDEEYIRKLADALAAFNDTLTAARLNLEREYGPFPQIKIPEAVAV